MLLKIAWLNIIKNKRRSFITVLLSTMCILMFIVFGSINEGSHHKMIKDSVETFNGYLRLAGKDYLEHPDYDHLIFDTGKALTLLHKSTPQLQTAIRFETYGLISKEKEAIGSMIIGIQPDQEAQISRLKKVLKKGRYLNETDNNSAYIGTGLAKKLNASLGDEIIFLSSAIDRSMAAGKLSIVGLFETHLFDFDASMIFIPKSYMDTAFLTHNMATQVIIQPHHLSSLPTVHESLSKTFKNSSIDVLTWEDTMKEFAQMVILDEFFGTLTLFLFAVIIFFVIMIFTTISIFQRSREIGIVRAIGTKPSQIWRMMGYEALLYSLISIGIGGSLGIGISYYFQKNPIRMTMSKEMMEMYKQYGYIDPILPAKLSVSVILLGIISVLLIHGLAIIFPTWSMIKKQPIEAILDT